MTRQLTEKEMKVLHLKAQGYTDRQIARVLSRSMFTVRNEMVNIHHKLGVKNTPHAIYVVFAQWPAEVTTA